MDAEVTPFSAFWIDGHTWTDSANRSEVCRLYSRPDAGHPVTPDGSIHSIAVAIAGLWRAAKATTNLSVASYTCFHDTEMECDGILSYDRTPKFSPSDTATIRAAAVELVGKPVKCAPLAPDPAAGVTGVPRWL